MYNVQLEGNCLVFSEFDEEAFELAVELEGLDESAYDVVENLETTQTLGEYGEAIRRPARFYDTPKYLVKIKLLECISCFNLTTVAGLRFYGDSTGPKELLIDLVIDDVFLSFMSVLLTQLLDGASISLLRKIDKAIFIVKNLCTINVRYFLRISCDDQLHTIELYPANNVTIERVSFEDY